LENTGRPIPAESLPFIFERFYRVEKSRSRDSGGSGIGPAIVKALVKAHGGRWSVKAVVCTSEGIAALDSEPDGFIDEEITNVEDLLDLEEMGYVEIMDTTRYFECPLLRHH